MLADNLRTNGIVMSTDDKVLYVTNGSSLTAFDVAGPGKLTNRRDFAKLEAGGAGADENGQPVVQGPQHTAATLYRLKMLSHGLLTRAK